MTREILLYEQVVHVAEDYFGPAAPRFMTRLIYSHLDKTPVELTEQDLPELTRWAALTVALLTDDGSVVEEFTQRLSQLASHQPASLVTAK